MKRKFVNRVKELQYLNTEYQMDHSSFVVLYGRRRIGKTTLIKKFTENKPALYFLASEELEAENIKSFQRLLADFTGNSLLKADVLFSSGGSFRVFKEYKPNEKKIVIIDEFQYLGKINKAFPSIFQRIWDELLKDEKVMVILCGSLIHMMESQTLSYSSPLYGRRTGQIKMKQISFMHYGEFFKNKNKDELIQYYAVTGGVPKYIELFKEEKDIHKSIENNIINKQSFLYEEPIFLLEKEVGDIGSYFSIIKTIAQGNHKIGKIASFLGTNQNNLTKYITTLINLDILERQVPITENNREKSKMGLYYIKDNFIEFWFKFIYPYRSYIEMEDEEYIISKIKNNFIDNHVSFVYEKVSIEELWQMNKENILPFKVMKIGKWWNNSNEIDIVALNEESKEILFGECKYLDSKVDIDIFYNLVNKSKNVPWHKENRKNYYVLFSRSGYTDNLIELSKNRDDLILKSIF